MFHGAHCLGHDLQNALDIGGVGSVCVALDPRMAGSILNKNIRALWAGKFEDMAFFGGKVESHWSHIKLMSCNPK